MINNYKTIFSYGCDETIINKSRFIGYAKPIKSEEEALEFIDDIKKKHRDATHNVYAYVVGDQNIIQRFSDDGEPSGTAGLPVLEVINKEKLSNIVILVTRYFGGIKLGTGGLIRAYTKGARIGLEAGIIIDRVVHLELELIVDYSLLGLVENFIQRNKFYIKNIEYLEKVSINLYIEKDISKDFINQIVDLTSNEVLINNLGEKHLSTKDGKILEG